MSEPALPVEYSLTLLRVSVETPATCSLETAARLAGIHPELLRHYCRCGFLGAARVRPDGTWDFDDDALFELRRLEHYRRHHGVDRHTLRLISGLWREIDRLQAEVRQLRGP